MSNLRRYTLTLFGIGLTLCTILLPQVDAYLQNPTNSIHTIRWNANSSLLAVGRENGVIEIIDVSTGQIIRTFNNNGATSLAWSPTANNQLAAVDYYGEIRIWDVDTGIVIFNQSALETTFGIAWSPDGSKIATGHQLSRGMVEEGTIKIWNASTGQLLQTFPNLPVTISVSQWSPDGSKLVGSYGTGAAIWNVNNGQTIAFIRDDALINSDGSITEYYVDRVAWRLDGSQLLTVGSFEIRLWDATNYQTIFKLIEYATMRDIAWKPDGTQFAVASGNSVKIINTNNGNTIISYSNSTTEPINSVAWSSDGSKLAYDGQGGNLQIVLAPLSMTPTPPPSSAGGTGLFGQFFDNADLTGFKLNRVDPTVNFTWGSGSPDPSIDANTFSARWTGQIIPQFSETYTFYTQSDDGVRLWVNDTLLINNWTDHSSTEDSATIALTANFRYNIKLEYYDNTFSSTIRLSWSSPSQPKQVVPQDRLFPNGKIVFQSNTTGNNEIFIMNADGTGVQNRTNNSASDTYPSVVPGGTQIVFVSSRDGNGEIYSMPLNGGTATNLTNNSASDNYPSLYQDGRIVFSSTRSGGNSNLWVRDAAGTVTQLTNTTGIERHSAWSPDGQWVVYDMEEGGVTHLYKIPAAGGTPVQLTTVASNLEPDWSLDGTKITFRSNRSGSSQVYVMDANGSNQVPFIATPPSGFNPTWGMDSGRVTFHSWKDSSQPEIYTLASGASAAVRLTNNSILDQYPVWGAQ